MAESGTGPINVADYERLGSEATVVTIIVDSGLRYLSTDLFRT